MCDSGQEDTAASLLQHFGAGEIHRAHRSGGRAGKEESAVFYVTRTVLALVVAVWRTKPALNASVPSFE